ncbi:MAG: AAA family ATPase [Chloroflexia bacterium]|nr:AAA family ATPase [Chloroflexia bacterium]
MTHLTISLLGTVQVLRNGQPVSGQAHAKVLGLLAYLAVEMDRPHARTSLALLFWPDQTGDKARHSLRQALSTLRRILQDQVAAEPLLYVTRETVQFRGDAGAVVDVWQLLALFDACDRHAHPRLETCPACAPRLEAVVALYRGDFLEGFSVDDSTGFEDWTQVWRQRLRQRVIDASFAVAAWRLHQGALDGVEHTLSRLLEFDPWNERAHRTLMEVLWKRGQRGAAIAQYERCRAALMEELGVEPDAETAVLLQAIRSGDASGLAELEQTPAPRPVFRLPVAPGRLVGRERELEEIADLLAHRDCRLLTLTGPGGSGKTRLAIEIASSQASHGHGVCFVALAAVREPAGIVPAIAAELGLTLLGGADPERQLVDWLRDRSMFLVLDNAEQVVEGMPVVARLLLSAPTVTVLVTSRERLNLRGEWVYDVAGLGVPVSDVTDSFEGYGSVELLGERLRQIRPRTPMRHEERPVVIRICQLVEGMPLAIELAAAWAQSLTLDQIEAELRRNLDFLSTSLRDVPDRHRSMRAVFNQT